MSGMTRELDKALGRDLRLHRGRADPVRPRRHLRHLLRTAGAAGQTPGPGHPVQPRRRVQRVVHRSPSARRRPCRSCWPLLGPLLPKDIITLVPGGVPGLPGMPGVAGRRARAPGPAAFLTRPRLRRLMGRPQRPDRSSGRGRRPEADGRRLQELEFLAEVARLTGSARTWDELMGTIVDRATAAAQAEVCSLYLMDRDGTGVTLAATNGLDPRADQRRAAAAGRGHHRHRSPRRASRRRALNVHRDRRFHWVRGVDEPRFTSMCSVPLIWNDEVVGVLNVQTVRRREFTRRDVSFLETLAGTAGRHRRAQPTSARGRGPGREPARHRRGAGQPGRGRDPRAAHAAGRRARLRRAARRRRATARRGRSGGGRRRGLGALRARAGRPARPDRRLDPGEPARPHARLRAGHRARPCGRRSTRRRRSWHRSSAATRSPSTSSSDRLRAFANADQLRRLLGYLLENASKYAPLDGTIDIYGWRKDGSRVRGHHRRRTGHSRWSGASASSSRSSGSTTRRAAPASACSRRVTWRVRWAATCAPKTARRAAASSCWSCRPRVSRREPSSRGISGPLHHSTSATARRSTKTTVTISNIESTLRKFRGPAPARGLAGDREASRGYAAAASFAAEPRPDSAAMRTLPSPS